MMTSTFQKDHPVGARPGTLVIPKDSPPPRIRVMRIGGGEFLETEVPDVATLAEILATPGSYWIDIQGWGDEALLNEIAELLRIHPLALEDAVNAPQRPKAELYEDHVLAVARTPYQPEGRALEFKQVCVFIRDSSVITFQERYMGALDPVRERARVPSSRIRRLGADYLGYALIDTLVDRFYPVVDEYGRKVDELEEMISTSPSTDHLMQLQKLRRSVVYLRRIAWAQREMVRELMHLESPCISDEVRIFLRDPYDHTAQIAEVTDSLRELVASLMDIYLSVVGQRTNEVMKVLTIMSSIFVPLTFMAGIYGMNFQHMPELSHPLAYPMLMAMMVVTASGFLLYFRSKGWIGSRSQPRTDKGKSADS